MKNYILEQLYYNPEIAGMIFFDGIDLGHRTYDSIDKEEPGYFRLLLDTFLKELNTKEHPIITIEYLKNLHKQCTASIPDFTDAGLLRPVSYFGIEIDLIKDPIIRSTFYNAILADLDYRKGFYNIFFSDLDGMVLNHNPRALHDLPPNSRMYMESGQNRNITADLQDIINGYLKLSDSATSAEKLKNLLKFIQRLERRHPFKDGNCRLFCMLLLNLELIRMGQYPTIQNNPNYFDWMPIDALVNEVIQGQKRFCNYLATKDKNIKFYKPNNEEILVNVHNWFYDLQHGHDCLWFIDLYKNKNWIREESLDNIYHIIYKLNNLPLDMTQEFFNNFNNNYIKDIAIDDLVNIGYKLLQEPYKKLLIDNFNNNPHLIPDNINFDHLMFFLAKLHPSFIECKWTIIQQILKDLEGHQFFSLFKILPKPYHLKFLDYINPQVYENISYEAVAMHLSAIFKWMAEATYPKFFIPIKDNIIKYLKTYDSYIPYTASDGELLYKIFANEITFSGLSIVEIRAILFKFIAPNVQSQLIRKNIEYLKKLVINAAGFDLIASVL
jgi:hypothetical protein